MYALIPDKKLEPVSAPAVVPKKTNNVGCMVIALVVVVGLVGYGVASNYYSAPNSRVFGSDGRQISGPPAASNIADRSDACFMSQKFVRQNLKAPTTAEFPAWTEENCNARQINGTWKVRSYVDSQNSYGAMIRSDYGVEMSYNAGADTWTLLDIAIVSP